MSLFALLMVNHHRMNIHTLFFVLLPILALSRRASAVIVESNILVNNATHHYLDQVDTLHGPSQTLQGFLEASDNLITRLRQGAEDIRHGQKRVTEHESQSVINLRQDYVNTILKAENNLISLGDISWTRDEIKSVKARLVEQKAANQDFASAVTQMIPGTLNPVLRRLDDNARDAYDLAISHFQSIPDQPNWNDSNEPSLVTTLNPYESATPISSPPLVAPVGIKSDNPPAPRTQNLPASKPQSPSSSPLPKTQSTKVLQPSYLVSVPTTLPLVAYQVDSKPIISGSNILAHGDDLRPSVDDIRPSVDDIRPSVDDTELDSGSYSTLTTSFVASSPHGTGHRTLPTALTTLNTTPSTHPTSTPKPGDTNPQMLPTMLAIFSIIAFIQLMVTGYMIWTFCHNRHATRVPRKNVDRNTYPVELDSGNRQFEELQSDEVHELSPGSIYEASSGRLLFEASSGRIRLGIRDSRVPSRSGFASESDSDAMTIRPDVDDLYLFRPKSAGSLSKKI
jgi:hypothetical protein